MPWIASLSSSTLKEWFRHKVPGLGAALAFYSALSIAPLLVVCLRIAAAFFGEEAAHGELVTQLRSLLGEQGSRAVQDIIVDADRPSSGTWATILGTATLLFGASGVFGQLQESLNTIWDVRVRPGRGLIEVLKDRFVSFAMVLGIAFLLLVSLVVTTVINTLSSFLNDVPEAWTWLAQAGNIVVSMFVVTLLFALMFKLLPDVRMAWSDVWLGAAITSILFSVGKLGIGVYLGQSAFASAYGAAGSFVVFLVWVYYSAQIFFLGAMFTRVYADRYGSRIVPAANAERVATTPVSTTSPNVA